MGFNLGSLGHDISNIVSQAGNDFAKVVTGGLANWNQFRNANEVGASLLGNYLLPGSSLLTDHLVSGGAQSMLGTPVGTLAQLGTGLAGAGIGSSVTGIPSSPTGGWSGAMSALGLGGTPATYNDFAAGAGAAGGATSAASPSILSSLGSSAAKIAPALQIGGGLYGILQSLNLQRQAQILASQSDPFSSSRGQYATQLNNLMANPSSITSLPGYDAGLQAVERSMASQGYSGSGNMMAALQQYGGQAYQQQVQTLEALSGANATPGAGAQVALTGLAGGTTGLLSSLSLLAGGLSPQRYPAAVAAGG